MIQQFYNLEIRGIVSAVPSKVESSISYAKILGERRVKKQIRFTGIESRHINDWNQTTADLCIEASNKLMSEIGWKAESIRVLILVTQSPSLIAPASSFLIHRELGLVNDCVVFDVNLGCTGYVTGLRIISSILQNFGEHSRGLLLVGDTHKNKYQVKPKTSDEMADYMLFGSAGTATALEVVTNGKMMCFEDKAYSERYQVLYHRFDEYIHMVGDAVFEFVINEVIDNIRKFMKVFPEENIDYYIFHQANKFILENIIKNTEIDEKKVLYSLKKFGNNSSASIPLTICYNSKLINQSKGKTLFLCGFGVGLACAIGWLKVGEHCYLDIVETDNTYPLLR